MQMFESATVGDVIDSAFPADGPPPAWDTDGAYTRASVRVYVAILGFFLLIFRNGIAVR